MIDDAKLKLPPRCKFGQRRPAHLPTEAVYQDCYADDENEFILAVARFRAINRIGSPTLCQLLWVAKQLGYHK